MHWSDVVAQRLSERGKKHIVSTGITPSGEFHIGHLREILTGDMIAKAAKKAGLDVDFQRALETSADTTTIIANKQALRDAPAAAGIATATTTDELKAQWDSTILGASPYS